MAARPGLSGEEDYSSFYPELRSGVLYDVAGRGESGGLRSVNVSKKSNPSLCL